MSKCKTSRRGWLARRCHVCLHKAFLCWSSPFPLERVVNGRCDGAVKLDVPPNVPLCRRCVDASGIEHKCNPMPVAKKRKRCHRCGGTGRVQGYTENAQWRPHRRGVAEAGTSIATCEDRTRICPNCGGLGEVPA